MTAHRLHTPESFSKLTQKEKRDTIFSYEMKRRLSNDELVRKLLDDITDQHWHDYVDNILSPGQRG